MNREVSVETLKKSPECCVKCIKVINKGHTNYNKRIKREVRKAIRQRVKLQWKKHIF